MERRDPKRLRRALLTLAVACATPLPMQPAWAQDAKPATKAPAKSTAKTTTKPAVMTRDELRSCMDQQDRLKESRTKIGQQQGELDKLEAQVKEVDAELQKKIAALDPGDVGARKALEDLGMKRDLAAGDYNARLDTLREQARDYEATRQSWVQNCANRNFDEMDEAAIKKERQQAARPATQK